jgi:hypothetical protein
MGLRRLLTDPNIYVDPVKQVYIIAYVDDIMCFGEKQHIESLITELQKRVLLKVTGHLVPGESLNFLGRSLHHNGDGVTFTGLQGYILDLLKEHNLDKCKPATTPGSSALNRMRDGGDSVTTEEHRVYRRAVGKLQWLAPIRPDICYSTKELARGLASPTKEHLAQLKHLLRYLRGTIDYCMQIRPDTTIARGASLDMDCYVDSDWAGCSTTRKSTSGGVVHLLGTPILTWSRTQSTVALSFQAKLNSTN